MKRKDALATDYWIDNTERIYEENLHVSSPIIDAYIAGFEKAIELAATVFEGHNQTFSTGIDEVDFTYRVMQIVSTLIREQGEEEV